MTLRPRLLREGAVCRIQQPGRCRSLLMRRSRSLVRRLLPIIAIGFLEAATIPRANAQVEVTGPGRHPPTTGMDRMIRTFLLADVLEYVPEPSAGTVRFDGLGWIGGDYNRIWLRSEAHIPTTEPNAEVQAEALYGRLLTPFWDAVAGLRVDSRRFGASKRETRGQLSVGFIGLSPYWIEMEPSLFISQRGDVSARLSASVDLLFTQRLILQPRTELNAAAQAVPRFGVGSGLNDVELGGRLRYEIRREFAPYIGLAWRRRTGATAALARAAGETVREGVLSAGVRMWR